MKFGVIHLYMVYPESSPRLKDFASDEIYEAISSLLINPVEKCSEINNGRPFKSIIASPHSVAELTMKME